MKCLSNHPRDCREQLHGFIQSGVPRAAHAVNENRWADLCVLLLGLVLRMSLGRTKFCRSIN